MPFTLAHPAAALPLRRRLGRLGSTSGLLVGSMIPDLAHFFPIGLMRDESHSVAGLIWYCLPIGMVAHAVLRSLLLPFGLALAPEAVRRRVGPLPREVYSHGRILAVAVSILVGAAGHLAWDSFTHSTGIVVHLLPVLEDTVPIWDGYRPHLFTLLQHLSTVVGMALLAFWAVRWYRRAPLRPQAAKTASRLARWSAVAIVGVPTMAAAILAAWPYVLASRGLFQDVRSAARPVILAVGTVFLSMLAANAILWRFRQTLALARRRLRQSA